MITICAAAHAGFSRQATPENPKFIWYNSMPKPKTCPHGTARAKILEAIEELGFCSFDDICFVVRSKLKPPTVRHWLARLQREQAVRQIALGVYGPWAKAEKLSRLEVMRIAEPIKYEVIKLLCKKGRPMHTTVLAHELHALYGRRMQVEASTFARAINQLRKEGILYRPAKMGRQVALLSNWILDLRMSGYTETNAPDWLKEPIRKEVEADQAWVANKLDLELNDLLS